MHGGCSTYRLLSMRGNGDPCRIACCSGKYVFYCAICFGADVPRRFGFDGFELFCLAAHHFYDSIGALFAGE